MPQNRGKLVLERLIERVSPMTLSGYDSHQLEPGHRQVPVGLGLCLGEEDRTGS